MRRRGAVVVLSALMSVARVDAQDTTVAVAAPHVIAVDTNRLAPYRRSYDVIVSAGDSSVTIGSRVVSLDQASYNGAPAWMVVETRSGAVPAAESLWLSRALRPLHWAASAGLARLGAEFVGDSIYAVTTGRTGRQNIVMAGRSDLLVSAAMVEALFGTLPFTADYRDSVAILDVTLTTSAWTSGEIAVVGEEDLADGASDRVCWVVALRQQERQALYWVEKSTGVVLRMQQLLPPHVGRRLEYRLIPETNRVAP